MVIRPNIPLCIYKYENLYENNYIYFLYIQWHAFASNTKSINNMKWRWRIRLENTSFATHHLSGTQAHAIIMIYENSAVAASQTITINVVWAALEIELQHFTVILLKHNRYIPQYKCSISKQGEQLTITMFHLRISFLKRICFNQTDTFLPSRL